MGTPSGLVGVQRRPKLFVVATGGTTRTPRALRLRLRHYITVFEIAGLGGDSIKKT